MFYSTNTPDDRVAHSLAWPFALALTTIVGTLAAACMLPFVALAVMAAATMSLSRAATTMMAVWLANQALGFFLLGYPLAGYTLAWGGALGGAGLAAAGVSAIIVGQRGLVIVRLLIAFAAAFLTFEGLLYLFATLAGGLETFTPTIVFQLAANDATWFAALIAVRLIVTRAIPAWFGPAATLRLA